MGSFVAEVSAGSERVINENLNFLSVEDSKEADKYTVDKMLARSRWDGILTQDEILFCREHKIAIGYDCAQIGWVVINEKEQTAGLEYQPHSDSSNVRDSNAVVHSELDDIAQLQASFSTALIERLQTPALKDTPASEQYKIALDLCADYVDRFGEKHSAQEAERLHLNLLKEIGRQARQHGLTEGPSDNVFVYRPWAQGDVADYLKLLANPNVWQYLPEQYPTPFTEDLAKDFIEIANLGNHHTVLAIECNGQVIGQIRMMYNQDCPEVRSAEIAYILAEEYWGQGLMKNILSDFTPKIIQEKNLDLVYAWIRPDNPASARTAEAAGYFRDCFSREQEVAEQAQRSGFWRYIAY